MCSSIFPEVTWVEFQMKGILIVFFSKKKPLYREGKGRVLMGEKELKEYRPEELLTHGNSNVRFYAKKILNRPWKEIEKFFGKQIEQGDLNISHNSWTK